MTEETRDVPVVEIFGRVNPGIRTPGLRRRIKKYNRESLTEIVMDVPPLGFLLLVGLIVGALLGTTVSPFFLLIPGAIAVPMAVSFTRDIKASRAIKRDSREFVDIGDWGSSGIADMIHEVSKLADKLATLWASHHVAPGSGEPELLSALQHMSRIPALKIPKEIVEAGQRTGDTELRQRQQALSNAERRAKAAIDALRAVVLKLENQAKRHRDKSLVSSYLRLPSSTPMASPDPQPENTEPFRLEAIQQAHNRVLARWRVYELDIAAMIDYPSMSDVRVPETAAMVRAMRAAEDARHDDSFESYRAAVRHFETAFDAAEHEARARAVSTLPEDDRVRLDKAKQLLAVAEDSAATEHERQTAYKRLRHVLDGLILIPPRALAELESKVMPQLTKREQKTHEREASR